MHCLQSYYLVLKSCHIISFVAWMAGLFYLPRLFVYHTQQARASATYDLFLTMERRLLRFIMLPAKLATFLFGILLVSIPGVVNWSKPNFYIKIFCALGLAAFHGMSVRWWKHFRDHGIPYSERFFRIINEVPTVLLIIIVFCAICK